MPPTEFTSDFNPTNNKIKALKSLFKLWVKNFLAVGVALLFSSLVTEGGASGPATSALARPTNPPLAVRQGSWSPGSTWGAYWSHWAAWRHTWQTPGAFICQRLPSILSPKRLVYLGWPLGFIRNNFIDPSVLFKIWSSDSATEVLVSVCENMDSCTQEFSPGLDLVCLNFAGLRQKPAHLTCTWNSSQAYKVWEPPLTQSLTPLPCLTHFSQILSAALSFKQSQKGRCHD